MKLLYAAVQAFLATIKLSPNRQIKSSIGCLEQKRFTADYIVERSQVPLIPQIPCNHFTFNLRHKTRDLTAKSKPKWLINRVKSMDAPARRFGTPGACIYTFADTLVGINQSDAEWTIHLGRWSYWWRHNGMKVSYTLPDAESQTDEKSVNSKQKKGKKENLKGV